MKNGKEERRNNIKGAFPSTVLCSNVSMGHTARERRASSEGDVTCRNEGKTRHRHDGNSLSSTFLCNFSYTVSFSFRFGDFFYRLFFPGHLMSGQGENFATMEDNKGRNETGQP